MSGRATTEEIMETEFVPATPERVRDEVERARVELHVKGPYFDRREAVTFSTSGFIGFCGWASGTNERPILDGFREWVETFQATPTEKGGA
jgi:hypothetical protein